MVLSSDLEEQLLGVTWTESLPKITSSQLKALSWLRARDGDEGMSDKYLGGNHCVLGSVFKEV